MNKAYLFHTLFLYSRQQRVREMSEIFLVELLEARKTDAQRCNMFIILLLVYYILG